MEDCESHEGNSRSTSIMAQLKNSLLSKLTELDPSLSIHNHHSSFIQHRLQQLFNTFKFNTPTHPPYALMIRRAITELNEGTGSSEEAITEFIRREYEDLPLAHVKILRIHLRKLCHEGELARTDDGRYVVLFDGGDGMVDGDQIEQCKGSNKRKRGKRRKGTVKNSEGVVIERDNGFQEEGIKKQIKMLELDGGSTNKPNKVVEWTQEHGEEEEEEESQIPVQCASILSKCRNFV